MDTDDHVSVVFLRDASFGGLLSALNRSTDQFDRLPQTLQVLTLSACMFLALTLLFLALLVVSVVLVSSLDIDRSPKEDCVPRTIGDIVEHHKSLLQVLPSYLCSQTLNP